ncbi:hypothetical protein L9F63_009254, partial [Diploptera punctata]
MWLSYIFSQRNHKIVSVHTLSLAYSGRSGLPLSMLQVFRPRVTDNGDMEMDIKNEEDNQFRSIYIKCETYPAIEPFSSQDPELEDTQIKIKIEENQISRNESFPGDDPLTFEDTKLE